MVLGNEGTDITREWRTIEIIKLGVIASIVIMRRTIDMIETMKTTIARRQSRYDDRGYSDNPESDDDEYDDEDDDAGYHGPAEDPLAITTILDVEDMDREDSRGHRHEYPDRGQGG